MADVKAFDRYGDQVTVPEEQLGELEQLGGRVASPEEIREASLTTAQRAMGAAGTAVGVVAAPLTFVGEAAHTATKAIISPMLSEAQRKMLDAPTAGGEFMSGQSSVANAMFNAATGGLGEGVIRRGLGAVDAETGAAYQKEIDELRSRNAVGTGIGNALGLAGSIALGGAGGAARFTPGGVVSGIGAGAESLAARGLARAGVGGGGAISRALGTGATLGARGAAEGAVMGASDYVGDALLEDHELTSEKLLAAAGNGALIGGVGGAALGGAGSLGASGVAAVTSGIGRLTRGIGNATAAGLEKTATGVGKAGDALGSALQKDIPTPQDIAAFAKKSFGNADPEAVAKAAEYYSKASAAVAGKDASTIQSFLSPTKEGAELRRLAVFDAEKVQTEATRAIRKHGDELLASSREVTEEAMGGLKASHVEKSILKGNEDATRAYAVKFADDAIARVEAKLQERVAPQMVKSLETTSTLAYNLKAAAAAGKSNAELFIGFDQTKRSLQRLASTGNRSVMNIVDPLEQIAARDSVKMFEEIAEQSRQALQDVGLWGKAAEQQKAINAAWTKQIDASRRFESSLTTEVGRDPKNPYLQAIGIDPSKTASYVRNLTNVDRDLTHKAVNEYLASTKELSGAIRNAYELDATKLAHVAKVESAASEFQKSLKSAEKSLVASNQLRELTQGDKSSMLGAAGAAMGGLPGGLLGLMGDALMSPGKTIARVAAAERLASKVDTTLASASKRLVDGPKPAAERVRDAVSRTAKKVGGSVQERARSAMERIATIQNEPRLFSDRIAKQVEAIGNVAPKIASSYANKAAMAASFLATKMPTPISGDTMVTGSKANITDGDAYKFLRYVRAVEDPLSVLEDMERGVVTQEGVEALKATSPRLYAELRLRTFDALADAQAKGKPVPYDRRLGLSMLFDIAGDRSLMPGTMAILQANTSAPTAAQQAGSVAPTPKGPSRPLQLPGAGASVWDRVESGRKGHK